MIEALNFKIEEESKKSMLEDLPKFIDNTNDEKLKTFYDRAYGKNHILNNQVHHNWQFRDNPFNPFKKKSIVVTENDGKISSHMGLFPIELKVFDDIKSAIWHISFYTLEEYRGKGLGARLVQFSSDFVDYTMVLSGSEGTKKIYLNQGGEYFGDLNRYVGMLNKERLEKYIKNKIDKEEVKPNNLKKFFFNRVNILDSKYKTFWEEVKIRYPITTNRTKEYLSWRYLNHPFIDYHFMTLENNNKLLGYAVLRFEDNNEELKAVRIVDMIILEGYENDLLQQVINYCFKKVDFIDFFCTGNFYKENFAMNYFFNNLIDRITIPTVFNPIDPNRRPDINFMYKCNNSFMKDHNSLHNINNWYFVKGDSDQDRANRT